MKKALVIIDMQNGFINEHTRGLVADIKKYAETNNFDEIVATTYVNNENTACYKFENWKDCMEGTVDAEVVPELAQLANRIFKKSKYSCWNQEFIDWIAEKQIDILYFVGVNTGCCVLHSAFDAYNDLYEIRVVHDLCGSSNGADSHTAALQVLRECITKQRVIESTAQV